MSTNIKFKATYNGAWDLPHEEGSVIFNPLDCEIYLDTPNERSKIANFNKINYTSSITSGTLIGTLKINDVDHPLYYTPGVSTSGSTVSVSQNVTSGTKIASITVDGSVTDLYTPTVNQTAVSYTDLTPASGTIRIGTLTINGVDTPVYAYQPTAGGSGENGKSAYELYIDTLPAGESPLSISEWLNSLKGEKGDTGERGPKGEDGVNGTNGLNGTNGVNGSDGKSAYELYAESTANPLSLFDWLLSLKGEQGPQGIQGIQGPQGERGTDGTGISLKSSASDCTETGDAYIDSDGHIQIYNSSTNTFTDGGQIKGPKGDIGERGPQGEQGIQGPKGDRGEKGEKGDTFTFSDLTQEEINLLKGSKGDKGEKGDTGSKGDKGDSFTFEDFTPEQFASLKGQKGDKGDDGAPGLNGSNGITPKFKIENDYWYVSYDNESTWTQLGKAKGDNGSNGENGSNGTNGISPHIDEDTGNWFIGTYDTEVHAQGPKGDKGDKGDSGEQGPQGNSGSNGNSIFVTYNANNVTMLIPDSGNGNGWSTTNASGAKWMSIKLAQDINSGSWSAPIKIKGEDGQNGTNGQNGSDASITVNTSISSTAIPAVMADGNTLYKSSKVTIVPFDGKVNAEGGFFETSDSRLKNHIGNVEVDLEALSKLPKAIFSFKDDENNTPKIGTYAQNLLEMYPELVNENEEGLLSVDYAKLSIIALAAIDKLYQEIKILKNNK